VHGIGMEEAEEGCKDRPHGFLQENTSTHKLYTGKKLLDRVLYGRDGEDSRETFDGSVARQEKASFQKSDYLSNSHDLKPIIH
jgi:hypothetical protein